MTSDFQDIPGDIILASASPRRSELLRSLGLVVTIIPSSYSEPALPHLTPLELSLNHAREKAADVAIAHRENLVIAADTVVDVDGEALGKPHDAATATIMLQRLSGRTHRVHTSIALAYYDKLLTHTETTSVRFFPLEYDRIQTYVASGEPFDKAGGYGIQGRGALLVERIDGDFYTVMGFPLAQFARLLPQLGLRMPKSL